MYLNIHKLAPLPITVFILLFDPAIGSASIKLSYILSIFFIIYILYRPNYLVFNKVEFNLIILYVPFVLYSFYPIYTSYTSYDYLEFTTLKNFASFILSILSAKIISKIYIRNFSQPDLIFIKHCFFAVLINSFIIIISFISSDFLDLLQQIFSYSPKQLKSHSLETAQFQRFSGLSYSGFSDLSLLTSLLLLCGIVYYQTISPKKVSITILFSISLGIVFLSMIFIARSGYILLFLFFFFYLVSSSIALLKRPYLSFQMLFIYLITFLMVSVIVLNVPNSLYREFILELFSLDPFNSPTVKTLFSMWIVPENTNELLFGSGNFGLSGPGRIKTDIGYVYLINGVGLFGVILFLLPTLFILFKSFLYLSRPLFYLSFFALTSVVIFNFKDFYFLGYYGSTFFILMLFYFDQFQKRSLNAER